MNASEVVVVLLAFSESINKLMFTEHGSCKMFGNVFHVISIQARR